MLIQQVVIHKRLFHLELQQRSHYLLKELGVTFLQKEVELVAHALVEELALLL